ncbi:hypothetical protein AALP_AA3G359600 [Arabis alpina]|uniref:Uncharacterized protein n=1 Tax=Arabis alpina TaxID=50452 RepID=A0A087HDW9_ARAAL|nr:hypothetical protein AALP_AA3G359600 [Arabis alpina]
MPHTSIHHPHFCHHKTTREDIVTRMIHDVPEGREIYGFRCECDRCKVESSWSEGEEEYEVMEQLEEDEEEEMEEEEKEEGCGKGVDDEASFPHAYFFVRYMCEKENCFGTLAPLPPKSNDDVSRVIECNVYGSFKEDEVGVNH